MTPTEKAQQLVTDTFSHPTVTGVLQDGTRVKIRLFKTSTGDVCYYKKGSRRRGYYLSDYFHLVDIIPIEAKKSKEQKWIDGWKKVRAKLQQSGLWANIIQEIDTALELGYKKMSEAYEQYCKLSDQQQLKYFQDNCPSLVGINDKNEPYIKCSILWAYAKLPIVKKMRFEKNPTRNEATLQAIQKAMSEKRTFHADGRTNYDISFEYAPEKNNKAWYSEEFKGCGNGHYYLALNSTHALFYEDD